MAPRLPSIALITDKLAGGSSAGGAFGHLTSAMTRGFLAAGVDELYVLYINGGPSPSTPYAPAVHLVSLGGCRTRRSPPRIGRFLREVGPDFLISMPSMVSIASLSGALLAGRHRTRLVINQVDTLTSDVAIEHAHDLRMRSLPFLARLLYRRADGLVAATEGVLRLMHANGTALAPEREMVIPIPVDIEKIQGRAAEEPEHPWLRHKETPVVVSLGRLVKRKNFPLLLQSFAEVRRRRVARLVIIGEGPERPVLEREIIRLGVPDVSLAGPEVNPWASIARADCFVMASDDEAFCLAIVEAMACGAPVVSTDAIGGGPRSILEDGRHGLLVPTREPRALADALDRVLGSDSVRQHYAAASRARCRSYEPVNIAEQWCEFLIALGNRQPRRGEAVLQGAALPSPSGAR